MKFLAGCVIIASIFGMQEELEYFQNLPKAELHLHLGGAYPLDYLLSIASEEQGRRLTEGIDQIAEGIDYKKAFSIFPLIAKIVDTNEKVERGVQALCKALAKDGIVYTEIRTGLKDLGGGYEEYLEAVLRGMRGYPCKLFLSLQRNSPQTFAKATVDLALKYSEEGVIGIDLSGDSTLGGVDAIFSELKRAKEGKLLLAVHMGESPDEQDQMKILEAIHPDRIGHGVYLCHEAEEWMLSHRVPLEVCLTCSLRVKMIERYTDHPGLRYFRKGHPIVFCTDDPMIFKITLSEELQNAKLHWGLTRSEIETIVNSSKGGLPPSYRSSTDHPKP